MEATKSTFEVKRKGRNESVEIRKVENGFVLCHYKHMGQTKEYIADSQEEAKKIAEECLEGAKERLEEDKSKPENPGVYENKY